MKELFDIRNNRDLRRNDHNDAEDSAVKQVAHAVIAATSLALFFATLHMQAG